MPCLRPALARVGYSSMSLKPEQKECIKCIFDVKDVFVWLPTGFGKSICYEVLQFMFDKNLGTDNSLVIVVSPLVSLMVDQVRSLRSRSAKVSVMFCTTLTPRRSSILGGTRCFATVGPKIAIVHPGINFQNFERPQLPFRICYEYGISVIALRLKWPFQWCFLFE